MNTSFLSAYLTSMARPRSLRGAAAVAFVLAAATVTPAFAQGGSDAPPAPPPIDPASIPVQLPPGPPKLSAQWTDADRTPEAVAKGTAALESLAQAHKGAKTMTNTLDFKSRHPTMGEAGEVWTYDFGADDDFRITTPAMKVTSVDDAIFIEHRAFSDRLLRAPVQENAVAALKDVLPPPHPSPLPELRQGLAGEPLLKAIGLDGIVQQLKVVGSRTVEGREQVLLQGTNGDIEVTIDPSTKLLRSIQMVLAPEPSQPDFTIAVDAFVESKLVDAIEPPIAAPDVGARQVVTTYAALMQPKELKVGDPFAFTFLDTDGAVVDSASLKGNVIVLDFWATWCGPCVASLPKLNDFAKWAAAEGKPVKVYGVNVWEQRVPADPKSRTAAAKEWWSKKQFSFPTLVQPDDLFLPTNGFQAIPVTLIIGLDGKVTNIHSGMISDTVNTLKSEVQAALDRAPTGG